MSRWILKCGAGVRIWTTEGHYIGKSASHACPGEPLTMMLESERGLPMGTTQVRTPVVHAQVNMNCVRSTAHSPANIPRCTE